MDSSVGGLGGGCPYAKGATGNVANELDVVYMLNGNGVKTNIDILEKLMLAGDFISKHLRRPSSSKTSIASNIYLI